MKIEKNTVFKVKNIEVILTSDMYMSDDEHGYFILNFWEQCEYEKLNVLPVTFVKCEDERELYVLKKDNIIIGSEKEICLI